MAPSRHNPVPGSFLAAILANPVVAAAAGLDPARGLDQVVTVTLRLNDENKPIINVEPVAHAVLHSFSPSELTYITSSLGAGDEYRFEFDDSAAPRFYKNKRQINTDMLIASLSVLTGKGRQAQRQLHRALIILNKVANERIASQFDFMADCVMKRLIVDDDWRVDQVIPEINLTTQCPDCGNAADRQNPQIENYPPLTYLTMQFGGVNHEDTGTAAFLDRIVTAHCRAEVPKRYPAAAARLAARADTLRDLLLAEKSSTRFDA